MNFLTLFFLPLWILKLNFLGSIISAGASLLGGAMNNRASAKAADAAWDRSEKGVRAQMDFQERMSNTAHQREIKDLKAAGLNPILSGTGGMGATTPGGAAPSGPAAKTQDILTPAVSSGLSAMRNFQEVENMAAAQANTEQDTLKKKAETITTAQQGMNYSMDYNLKEQQIENLRKELQLKTDLNPAQITNLIKQAELFGNSAKSQGVTARTDEWSEQAGLKKIIEATKAAEGATSAVRNLNPLSRGRGASGSFGRK